MSELDAVTRPGYCAPASGRYSVGMDHKSFLQRLDSAEKERLTARTDAPGLWHLAGHGGVIAVLGGLIAAQVPGWWIVMLPQGIAIAFLFTLQHEATHKTPFASPVLNEAVGHLTGLLLVQPFLWFRYFHFAHHRYTNDPEKDPELSAPKPETWPEFVWHLSTLGYWRDKAALLGANAFGRIGAPYLPPATHARLRREARAMLVVYAGVAVFSVMVSPVLIRVWLAPLVLGFPVLRLYLLAEHARCPRVADMFLNTRTTFTNRIVYFLAWNMPYHIEHHVYPQVPFHRLPRFHAMTRDLLGMTAPGYAAFTRNYVQRFGDPD